MCRKVLSIAVATFLIVGCSSDAPYCYPHDVKRRDLAKLYLMNDSSGHSIVITANDTLIWRGALPKSDEMPNIHAVGIPPEMQQTCRVHIAGGPFSAERDVDWQKGKALVVNFGEDRVALTQRQEPVGFQ